MGSLAVVCGEVSVSSEKRRFVLGVDFGPRESILSILLRIRVVRRVGLLATPLTVDDRQDCRDNERDNATKGEE